MTSQLRREPSTGNGLSSPSRVVPGGHTHKFIQEPRGYPTWLLQHSQSTRQTGVSWFILSILVLGSPMLFPSFIFQVEKNLKAEPSAILRQQQGVQSRAGLSQLCRCVYAAAAAALGHPRAESRPGSSGERTAARRALKDRLPQINTPRLNVL